MDIEVEILYAASIDTQGKEILIITAGKGQKSRQAPHVVSQGTARVEVGACYQPSGLKVLTPFLACPDTD